MTLPPGPRGPVDRRPTPVPPVIRRRVPARPRSPFPPEITAAIAVERRSTRPARVREPMTPFIVLRFDATDKGERPHKGGDADFSFWIEDVTKPGARAVLPLEPKKPYRFHVRVMNLGAAPIAVGMVELHAGGSLQYPESMRLFAMKPFSCDANAHVEVVVETVVPDDLALGSNSLTVHAFDLLQDPVTAPFDPWLDRHVLALLINKV